MPAPLARGIIIAASVIVAAGIAAYENPQFREWLDKSREKIAIALQSTIDDIRSPQPKRDDPSMREDQDEKAEERRRQARQEILDRGKQLEELRRRKTTTSNRSASENEINEKEPQSPSFDSLVDADGKLKDQIVVAASSSAVEPQDTTGTLRSRHTESQKVSEPFNAIHQSVDAPMLLRHLEQQPSAQAVEPWESQYEREMRNTFNMPLPQDGNRTPTMSHHPSESVVDVMHTPRTEDFPDPDYSIPSRSELGQPLDRTEYFSIPPSRARSDSSHTMSDVASEVAAVPPSIADSDSEYYYAHPSNPFEPLRPRPIGNAPHQTAASTNVAGSSAVSVAGTSDIVELQNDANRTRTVLSDFELSSDEDGFSEIDDGVRTPASAWTEIGSRTSSVAGD